MPYATVPAASNSDVRALTTTAEPGLSNEMDLGGLTTGLLKHTVSGGVSTPATASPTVDYISPAKTANVASATTITLPETGSLVPITGATTIDFITKPTGDAPRQVILWFQSTCAVRHEVAGAGAGAANISVVPGGLANNVYTFLLNSLLSLEFDGANWRKFPAAPHFDGSTGRIYGARTDQHLSFGGSGAILTGSSAISLAIDTGAINLQWGSTGRAVKIDSTGLHLTNDTTQINLVGRVCFAQGSVASASNIALPAFSSVLVTGTATINTFTATSLVQGVEYSLEFADVLTITNNSGGANDFMSKDGANITTSAGMVVKFRYDGTDLREIGRSSVGGVASGSLVKSAAGVPAAANPALDYTSPAKTADVASATTITLPETGGLVPITGTTTIDFITKPTGDAPRTVLLWFQSICSVRHEVAGAGAGAANVSMVLGGTVNTSYAHTANSLLPLEFDGTNWRKFPTGPHWDGTAIYGTAVAQKVSLGASPSLERTTAQRITIASSVMTIEHSFFIRLLGRMSLVQGTVASASQVTFPQTASCLVTGTTTMNTFVGTGFEAGMMIWLAFDNVLTITCNSGGTNDFVSKDGTSNITTAAGMVLCFRSDGTDLREVGRP